jgi:hypothetical protein
MADRTTRGARLQDAACVLRSRRKRLIRRLLPFRGTSSMSLTSLAPPLRRSSTILRLWNASSSAVCDSIVPQFQQQ